MYSKRCKYAYQYPRYVVILLLFKLTEQFSHCRLAKSAASLLILIYKQVGHPCHGTKSLGARDGHEPPYIKEMTSGVTLPFRQKNKHIAFFSVF